MEAMSKTIDVVKLAEAFRAAADAADPYNGNSFRQTQVQNNIFFSDPLGGCHPISRPVDVADFERQRTVSAVLSAIAGVFEAIASESDKEKGRPGITAEEIQTIQQGESS
jgi:hypothetical protein